MPDLITRRAPLSTFDLAARTVDCILSGGADVERRDARGSFIERLRLDGLTLPDRLPLLDSHRRDTIAAVLGHADNLRAEGNQIRCTLHVADTRALELIESGTVSAVSIGYLPTGEQWLNEGGRRVRSLSPAIAEASLTVFPADPAAAILRNQPVEELENRAETNAAIRTLVRTAGLPAAFGDNLIDEGASIEMAQASAFREMTSRPRVPVLHRTAEAELPELRTRMAAALAARLGAPGELAAEAMQYRAMSLHDMGRELLSARGERMTGGVEALLLRMTTTGDLPGLLVDAGNRRLLASYQSAASPVKALARQSSADDFRAKTALRVGAGGLLERVKEHGEVRHGAFVETKETYKLETFAKIWSITRQALINDDLNAFGDMNAMMGRAASETEARNLVDLLTQNAGLGPTMDDGNTLYDTLHGNEAATGTTIDAAALAAGVRAMRVQQGLTEDPINAVPAYLLVSPEMEQVARQSVASYYPATAATTNPLAGTLQVLVEPRLVGKRWYLFADPAVLPVLEYSYLSSAPGPQMQSREGFDVLGMEFRVVLDYGAGVLDWRGTFTNAGA